MAQDKPTKTLEQITQDVLNSPFGISDEDLTALFADVSTDKINNLVTSAATPSQSETVQQPQLEQTGEPEETPPAESASGASSPPTQAPDTGRAGVVPVEVEAMLKEQQQQLSALRDLVQRLAVQNQATAQPEQRAPIIPELEEIDDQHIIERPKESITRLVQALLKATLPVAFSEYDKALAVRAAMEAFRQSHPDFDELRPIMRQIVLEDPANDHPSALPRVYEEAKRRKAAMIEALKRELVGNATQQAPQAGVNEEEFLTKLEQRIAEKLRKRRAGAGAVSPQSQPVSPVDRMTPQQKELPKTEADAILEAMLNSGVPSERFLKGVEAVKK